MRFKTALAALAASAAFASPAAAQVVTSNAQAEARGTILQPLSLSRDQDLDFGTILVDPLGAGGSVAIDADDGSRSVAPRGTRLVSVTSLRKMICSRYSPGST